MCNLCVFQLKVSADNEDIEIAYLDEENDLVVVASDDEWKEAIKV